MKYFLVLHDAIHDVMESKPALEDEGYENGSENFNIPTPLRRTSKIHHVSSVENASFDPDPVIPHSMGTRESHCRHVHRCLTYSSSEEDDGTPTDEILSPDSIPQVQYHIDASPQLSSKYTINAYVHLEEEEEEDFQTILLDDEYSDMKEISERQLCIHEHSLLHEL